MLQGKQWPAFLRFWTETLEILVRKHAEFEGSPRGDALLEAVGPVIPGAGIIMSVSFLERVILDKLIENNSDIKIVKLTKEDWKNELGLDENWEGWPLVEILTRLRHCFAHEYGRATEYQINKLKVLLELITNEANQLWQASAPLELRCSLRSFYRDSSATPARRLIAALCV